MTLTELILRVLFGGEKPRTTEFVLEEVDGETLLHTRDLKTGKYVGDGVRVLAFSEEAAGYIQKERDRMYENR